MSTAIGTPLTRHGSRVSTLPSRPAPDREAATHTAKPALAPATGCGCGSATT